MDIKDRKYIESLKYTGNVILVAHYENGIKTFGPIFEKGINYAIRNEIPKNCLLGISFYEQKDNLFSAGIKNIMVKR